MSAESSNLKRPRILNGVKGKQGQASQEESSADLHQQLAVFGVAGMIIDPIIGSLYVAIWQRWGSAVDEARGENQVQPLAPPDEHFAMNPPPPFRSLSPKKVTQIQ